MHVIEIGVHEGEKVIVRNDDTVSVNFNLKFHILITFFFHGFI